MPTLNRLFMRLAISAVEAPIFTQISLSELNDRSPVTQLQIMVSVFRLNYVFRRVVETLMVCTFSGGFLYELPFHPYKAFKSPTLYSKFR